MRSPSMMKLAAVAVAAMFPAMSGAQTVAVAQVPEVAAAPMAEVKAPLDTAKPKLLVVESKYMSMAPKIEIQNFRTFDKRGINVFESPKEESQPYTGFKLAWGAGFTQQFQGLDHSNQAAPRVVNGTNRNELVQIGHGFNNAQANLHLNAQVAKGVRVALTTYLSTRHHNETWVKDGYFLIDDSPIAFKPLEDIMKYVTLRIGHLHRCLAGSS